jgi:hypothetical protein
MHAGRVRQLENKSGEPTGMLHVFNATAGAIQVLPITSTLPLQG